MGLLSPGAARPPSFNLPLLPRCGACGLSKTCRTPKMPVWGQGARKILIVGEAPGQQEDMQGRPFVGKTGRYLRNDLKALGLDPDQDCWFTNSIICRPPNNQIPNESCVDDCRPNVVKTIRTLQPHVIVLLGKQAVRSVVGWVWKEDVGAVGRWVGWRVPGGGEVNSWLCPSYHPSHILREDDPVMHRDFTTHLRGAVELAAAHPWPDGVPDRADRITLIWHDAEAVALLARLAAGKRPVAFDYETNCLKPDGPHARIVCVSVSDGRTTAAFLWTSAVAEAFRKFLISPVPKVGYNLKFETRWSIKHLGVEPRNAIWDGMIAAHILDNRRKITSLKFQAFVRLGQGDYDSHIKPYLQSRDEGGNSPNRIHELDPQAVLTYCALDSLLEWEVARHQKDEYDRQTEALAGHTASSPP